MHGLILIEFKRYVESSYGKTVWQNILEKTTNNPYTTYTSVQTYPDAELESLLAGLSKYNGQSTANILRLWGRYTTPNLIKMYKFALEPEWRTLDFLANVQNRFHVKVTQRYNVVPPLLNAVRLGPSEVLIVYTSQRQMCEFAWGLAEGAADYFGEQVAISQPLCMLRGDSRCEIKVKLTK